MQKVLLIINPCSGKQKIHAQLLNIIQILNNANYEVQVEITKYHNHAIELAQNSDKDIIICAGGDGTLNQVITGLIKGKKNTPVGYIPAGSTNDFSSAFNIDSNLLVATNNIIKKRPHNLDIGQFFDQNSLEISYFSYIASFGLFTSVSYQTPQEIKNVFGHTAYVFEGMKDLANIKSYDVSIDTGEKKIKGEYIFGAVMNTTTIGGVVHINTDVDMSDGLFEVVLVKMPNSISDLIDIFNGISSSNFSGKMFEFIKTPKVKFHFKENISWSLDGEKKESGKNVTIENLNKRIVIYK